MAVSGPVLEFWCSQSHYNPHVTSITKQPEDYFEVRSGSGQALAERKSCCSKNAAEQSSRLYLHSFCLVQCVCTRGSTAGG
jgi:hypothetical protein